ncbi:MULTISPECIES: alpha/beta hydrolase domain-containing protein [unclassified Frankia]
MGPIPVTVESGPPFGGAESPVGLDETSVSELLRRHDFVEEEFFVSGTVDGQPYTTSLLIRRPATAAGFSGLIALEPVHVQGALGLWQTCHPAILADGHVWVTVGSQLAAVEGPIKLANPSRYAGLHVPSVPASEESFAALLEWQQGDDANPPRTLFAIDAVSNEIMTQVGVLLKTGSKDGPLPGFTVERLIMGGASQTGMATLNYIVPAIQTPACRLRSRCMTVSCRWPRQAGRRRPVATPR